MEAICWAEICKYQMEQNRENKWELVPCFSLLDAGKSPGNHVDKCLESFWAHKTTLPFTVQINLSTWWSKCTAFYSSPKQTCDGLYYKKGVGRQSWTSVCSPSVSPPLHHLQMTIVRITYSLTLNNQTMFY